MPEPFDLVDHGPLAGFTNVQLLTVLVHESTQLFEVVLVHGPSLLANWNWDLGLLNHIFETDCARSLVRVEDVVQVLKFGHLLLTWMGLNLLEESLGVVKSIEVLIDVVGHLSEDGGFGLVLRQSHVE